MACLLFFVFFLTYVVTSQIQSLSVVTFCCYLPLQDQRENLLVCITSITQDILCNSV
jgi:hypothetical protein